MATLETPHLQIHLDEIYTELDNRKGAILDIITENVTNNAPVRTGYLKSTIHRDEDSVMVDAEYAPYVEYRTNFFSDAVANSYAEVQKIWEA